MVNLTRTLKELHICRKMMQKELRRVDTAILALRGLNGSSRIFRARVRPKRRMSAAARKRISLAQKARWAARRAKKPSKR